MKEKTGNGINVYMMQKNVRLNFRSLLERFHIVHISTGVGYSLIYRNQGLMSKLERLTCIAAMEPMEIA